MNCLVPEYLLRFQVKINPFNGLRNGDARMENTILLGLFKLQWILHLLLNKAEVILLLCLQVALLYLSQSHVQHDESAKEVYQNEVPDN